MSSVPVVVYRAGWPDKPNRRRGRGWIWLGPWVFGTRRGIERWDEAAWLAPSSDEQTP